MRNLALGAISYRKMAGLGQSATLLLLALVCFVAELVYHRLGNLGNIQEFSLKDLGDLMVIREDN